LALSIIGYLPIADLHRAIHSEDIRTICKIPGIGKKNAERLIIEMRDKINALLPLSFLERSIPVQNDPFAQKINDAMNALLNLGCNQMTAQKAIKQTLEELPEGIDLATLITNALKHI
jgi:Holliday junction DNA helicase RuvA